MDLTKRSFEYTLFLLTGTIVFQSVFFFVSLGINNLSLVLATILYLLFCYFFKDDKKFNKKNIFAILIVWVVIVLLFFYYRNFNECTYDGQYYHGNAMVNMLNGWNPFLQADNYEVTGVTVWADYYPKATWLFGANLIKLFNNLSAGMIINLLVDIALAVYGFVFTYEWKHKKILSIIIGFVLLINPIAIEQMHSYYVDAVLGNLTIILIMLCAKTMSNYKVWDNILIVLVSVFMINVKFTGFGFAGIVNLITWIYLFFKNRRAFIKYTISGVAMLVIAVLIVGFSPYFINIIKLRHIFYPIAGKNAEDVVTYMIPEEIKTWNFYHKFTYSLTSGEGLVANLKDFEVDEYLLYDERIGAMGKQFLKILILSAIGFIGYLIKNIKDKKVDLIFWLSVLSLFATIVVNFDNMWWFRYIPQIWAFVPIGMVLLSENKLTYIVIILMMFLIIKQNYNIAYNTIDVDYKKSRSIENLYEDYKGQEIVVQIDANTDDTIEWFDDYEIARAKQYGVDIKEVKHNIKVDKLEPYFMHYYKVYVLK